MHEALTISRRIARATAVSVLSFFLMIWFFHFIPWFQFPDFWGGMVLIVKKYMAGDLTGSFLHVWLKAVVYSATHWKGALEISSSAEISFFLAWAIDRWLIKYHSRFLLDSNSN